VLPTVRRCLLCTSTSIRVETEDRFVRTRCDSCGAHLIIEFDPPGRPGIRAAIERVVDVDGADAGDDDRG
jgi:transposase-like protein